jgi:hypothetical protein
MTVCDTCGGNGYLRHDDDALCPDCVVPDDAGKLSPHHPAPREVVLEIARSIITADLWSFFIDADIDAVQAATMMALMKAARMKADPKKEDNYIDAIGYLAIAYELAQSNDD